MKPQSHLTSQDPLHTGDNSSRSRIKWGVALIWFMRIIALLWLAKGVRYWVTIFGIDPGSAFEGRVLSYQATVVYFAVIDLVAAVGLWLKSTWGGVLWLLALMSYVILAFFFPKIVPFEPFVLLVSFGLVVSYLTISWMASHEES